MTTRQANTAIPMELLGHPLRSQNINTIHTRTRPWRRDLDKDIFSSPHALALPVYLLVYIEDVEVPVVDAPKETLCFKRCASHKMIAGMKVVGIDLLTEL